MVRLKSLDGLRGVGAVLVALGHLELAGLAKLGLAGFGGYVLVDFFFVLSGFVIAMVYADRIDTPSAAAAFAVRRTGRVWPLHAFVMLLFIGVETAKLVAVEAFGHVPTLPPFGIARPDELILPTFLMLHVFGISDQLVWNYPSWSAAAEFWVYLLYGVVALVLVSTRLPRVPVAILLAVAAAAVVITQSPNRMNATYDFGAVRAAYGFFVGVVAEAAWRRGVFERVRGTTAELLATVACLAFILTAAGTPAEYLAPPMFAVLMLLFAGDRGLVSRVLSLAPFQMLGQWSYSIYMMHAFVLTCLMNHLAPRVIAVVGGDLAIANAASVAIYLTLVIGLSAVTYRFVELPGQAVFRGLAERLPKGLPSAASPTAAVRR